MSNAINKQIKANSGGGGPRNLGSHSEVSNTTFKMTQPVQAIANMGEPLNYGTASDPIKYLDDDPKKKKAYGPQNETREERGKRTYEEALEKDRKRTARIEAEKNAPKKRSLLPKITMGMGSSYTTVND